MQTPSWVRRRVLYEGWTLSERAVFARRRARWPAWRRAVRPVGAAASGLLTLISIVTGVHGPAAFTDYGGTITVLVVIVVACVAFGIIDGVRARRAEKLDAPA